MSDDSPGQSETGTHESGGVEADRRNLLQALGAGSLAAAELSGVSGAQDAGANSGESGFVETNTVKVAENSEVIENDLVKVVVPTTVEEGRTFLSELARDGDPHASDLSPAPRDPDGNTLKVTGVLQVARDGNNVVVKREGEISESTLESRISVTVPQGVPGALIEHTLTNVSSEQVELNTPGFYVGTDIGLGEARLTSPGDAYRFSVEGGDSVSYEETSQFSTFDLTQSRPWLTSFDDERAITYGLDGPTSASDPNLAMVNLSVDAIRLFGTAVTLEPGESATWRTAAVAHDGGPEAPATGGDLVDAVFDGEEPPSPDPTGTVTGQVTDTLGPLADVSLEFVPSGVDAPAETTTTDDSGDYEVELPVDNYVITALKEGYDPTEVPVSVEEDTTSTVDIELTAVNPPVKILSTEVGPENLLRGTDTDIAFFVGVATSDEADVEVDEVDVLEPYTDDEISAQQITDVDGVTLRESLHRATNTGPFLIPFPVDFAKELLNRPAKQIYHVSIPSGPTPLKNGDNRFRMRVTGSDGTTDVVGVDIPQYSQGDKLASFNTTVSGPDVDFSQEMFLFNHTVGGIGSEDSMPGNIPLNLNGSLLEVNLDYTGEGTLNLNTLAATAASRSAFGVSVAGTGVGEVQLGARWDGVPNQFTYGVNIADLWFAGIFDATRNLGKLSAKLPPNPIVGSKTYSISLTAFPGGYMLFGNSNPDTPGTAGVASVSQDTGNTDGIEYPVLDHKEVNFYFSIDASAPAGILAEVYIGGSIHAAGDLDFVAGTFLPPALSPVVPVGGEICLNGGIRVTAGPYSSGEFGLNEIADVTPGFEDPCAQVGDAKEPPCWEVFGIDGDCQEYPSPSSLSDAATGYDISSSDVGLATTAGQNPPADAVTAETEAAVLTRLTDRAEIDSTPTVAARMSADEQDEHLAVWERHPENTPAEDGRTLVTATHDGTGWSDPTTLADTTTTGESYHEPAVATDAGTAAIAWTRYEIEGADTPPSLDEATQIELIVEDDTGWSDPVVAAETSDWFDSNPAIAPLGDGWVVAWEREKLDNNTRAVGYAVLDATGAVQRSETIMEATQLGVTQFDVGIGDDSVVLGYYDRATQQIRRDLITQSDRTTDQTYDLADGLSVRDLSIAAQDTAWLVTDEETTTGFYATGTSVEELPFVSLESSLSSLNLVETIAGPVLTAARVPEEDVRERSFIYHLRDGDTWRPEQVPASTDASGDVKLTESAVAPTPDRDGLVSLVKAKVHDPEAVSDIAAVEQPLRPHYSITAEADQETVPPGEQMTVSYTIENTGDLDGDAIGDDPVMVEARSQGNTLADQQESPLARGETATGELTFTVDETGTVDIVVGRELDLLDPAEQRTTIEASTPLLAVESTSIERPDEGTAVGTVQIRNGGLIDADDFDIEVYAGDDTLLEETQVNGPAAGERSSATVEFDPSELVLTGGEQVHIDPEEELPDSHVTQRVSPVLLGRPDVTVADDIEYSETDAGAVATLEMTNAGPVPTSAVVRAVRADATPEDGSFADEDLLGTVAVDLPAAIDGAAPTTSAVVTLEGVGYGEEVRFIVESDRPVAGAGVPVVYDRVGPFGPGIRALPGYDTPPQDIDGDGLYEDIDGNGSFDIFDVQALFNGLESDPVQNNPEAFNFNDDDNPDDVSIFDVQGLFELLE